MPRRRKPARKPTRRRKPAGGRISLRGYARHLGVTLKAVQKAIASGRLKECLGRDKRIADVALADKEWAAGAAKAANGGGKQPLVAAAAAPTPAPVEGTLVEAQLRVAAQRADALELANKLKRGELVDAGMVERENFETARMLRDRILNVPERLADLEPAVRGRIRDELRQALGELAEDLEHA